MRQPFDIQLIPRDNIGPAAQHAVQEVLDRLTLVREIGAEKSKEAQERMKTRHDIKAKASDFQPNDLVFMKLGQVPANKSRKLEDGWTGPFYIRHKAANDTYKLARVSDNKLHKPLVNAQRLKPAFDPMDLREPPPQNPPDRNNPQRQNDNPQPPKEIFPQTKTPVAIDSRNQSDQSRNIKDPKQKPTLPPPDEVEIQQPTQPDDQEYYEAEKLLNTRVRNQKREYLVKWVGDDQPSWQPHENITQALKQEYLVKHTRHGKRRKKRYRFFDQSENK